MQTKMSLRKRTRKLGCIIPGLSSSSTATCASSNKGLLLEDDDDDDCCSRRLIEDNEEPEGKSYNLSRHDDDHPFLSDEFLQPLNDTTTSKEIEKPLGAVAAPPTAPPGGGGAMSPATASEMTFFSDSSSGTWPEMIHSCLRLPDLELEQSSISSGMSSTMTPSSLKSASLSAPNSPHSSSVYSTMTPVATHGATMNNNSFHSSSGGGLPLSPSSVHSAPLTPTRSSRLPLTSPLPRRSPSSALGSNGHRKSHSTSNLLLPMTTLQPPPCRQVEETLKLLKSIKQQIKALKRRESHLSTKLQVQRRERQQMQEQIGMMESRRLRLEALFLRPLPLVLLLPVSAPTTANSSLEDEYDLCLVSEGQDSWNALQPMIRIQLVPGSFLHQGVATSSSRMGTILLHFGPTLTQPMAASITFLRQDPIDLPHSDLQSICKQMDFPFWQRATCGQVLEPDGNQLSEASCKFLFEALTEHKDMWRQQLSHVVDTKTRRIKWIRLEEADSLYYQAIPSSATAAGSMALVELD